MPLFRTCLAVVLILFVQARSWAAVPDPAPAAANPEPAGELPAVDVTASRLTTRTALDTGTPTVLRELAGRPGVDLASQGGGAQTDLRLRGSAFSGAGLSVAGLGLRNPQTEHFNSELPLPPGLFAPPRVLCGLDQFRDADGHLVGTVDFDFAPVENRGAAEAGFGEAGRNWQSLFAQTPISQNAVGTLGGGVFAGREHADRTDGQPDNFLDRTNGGVHLQQQNPAGWQADFVAAEQVKKFGARGFYGSPASLPSQEELTDRLVLGSVRREDDNGGWVRGTAAFRELVDEYELDRDRSWLYRNENRSRITSAAIDGRQTLSGDSDGDTLALRWRGEAEQERLASQYAGAMPSTSLGDHRRETLGLMLLPEWTRGPLTLSLGGQAKAFTDDSPAWLPAAGAEYHVSRAQSIYINYTENVRQPSFTELNYNSPGSLGNNGLKRQHDRTIETGWKGRAGTAWDWRTAVFAVDSSNAVDWIKRNPAGRWTAVNLGNVRTLGATAGGGWQLDPTWACDGAYTFLHKSADHDGVWASRYVLDYAEHDLAFGVRHILADWCEIRVRQEIRMQADNPARADGDTALPAAAEIRLNVFPRSGAELVLGVENLWASQFQVLPGQPPASRRYSAALAVTW